MRPHINTAGREEFVHTSSASTAIFARCSSGSDLSVFSTRRLKYAVECCFRCGAPGGATSRAFVAWLGFGE